MSSTSVKGPAGSLHVDDDGAGGVPVVFVHSFAGSTRHWSAQLAHLRGTRRALALDLRGHGKSAPPANNDYAVDSLAKDIGAMVDAKGLERFVLVGHSLGGAAGVAYAGAHPDRVAGLLVVATPGGLPPDQAQQIMTSMEADYEKVTSQFWNRLLTGARPEVLASVKSEMNSVPREAALSIIRATFAYDPVPALQRYPGPKLAITTPQADAPHELHKLVPDVSHEVITDTSHWPHMDRPEEFNRLLDGFITTVESVWPRPVNPVDMLSAKGAP